MAAPGSTTALVTHRILRAASRIDLGAAGWEEARGVGTEIAPPLEARAALADVHVLWERAVRSGGGATFPADAATLPLAEMRSVVTFLCTSSASLGEALERMLAFWPLVTDATRWHRAERADGARYVLEGARAESLGERCHLEYELVDALHTGRAALGGHTLPIVVRFPHVPPLEARAHAALAGVDVRWGAGEASFEIPAAALGAPMATAAPGLAALLEDRARAALPDAPATTAARMRGELRRALEEDGDLRLERVARRLGLGGRTLLRRLRAEGESFQGLVDDVRRSRATELLARAGSKEVAVALGFSDPRAFARAFRRWTGSSPGAFRRAQRG